MKQILSVILTVFVVIAHAQKIAVPVEHFFTGTYGKGSYISVPLKLDGIFKADNKFELYLSDANGDFTTQMKIGEYNSFFTPFINGIIPSTAIPGTGYKLKVISTSPVTEMITPSFEIGNDEAASFTVTSDIDNTTIDESTFGKCSNSSYGLPLSVTGSDEITSLILDNNFTEIATDNVPGHISFSVANGKYYTVQARTSKNGVWSIRTYLVLASTRILGLQNDGNDEICLPAEKVFTINTTSIGGIANNYPGTLYTINWGDGKKTSYTHVELISRNGSFSHLYETNSCGQKPIETGPGANDPILYNAFRISIEARSLCNAFVPTTTYTKIWEKPKPDFTYESTACVNKTVRFTSNSVAGSSAPNNEQNCIDDATYYWYVNGRFIPNPDNNPYLDYKFEQPGTYQIKLVMENDPCSGEVTKNICVEPEPVPDFTMNGANSLSGCIPFNVSIQDKTNGTTCQPFEYKWEVLNANGSPASAKAYTVQGSNTNPDFKFLEMGGYLIRLTVKNTCGSFTEEKPVKVLGITNVVLPGAVSYCGNGKIINFGTDVKHRPTYSSITTSDKFNWQVTGGAFSFVGGTTEADRFPQIKFDDYGIYKISVTYTNDCGNNTAFQEIKFDEQPTVDAGPNEIFKCYSDNSIILKGASTGPLQGVLWTTNGTGIFSEKNNLETIYIPSKEDKDRGFVQLTLKGLKEEGSSCIDAVDVMRVNIAERLFVKDGLKNICSGVSVNYIPQGNGSAYSWTATVLSGTVSGYSTSGTGNINDILENAGNTKAVVVYSIIPEKDGCTGEPGTLEVTIMPVADVTVPSDLVQCSNDKTSPLNFSSSLNGTTFTWTNDNPSIGLAASGTGNIPEFTVNNLGTDLLVATITVTPLFEGCPGKPSSFTITVKPKPTPPTVTSQVAYCLNTTTITPLNATPLPGHTVTWYTKADLSDGSTQAPTPSAAIPGTYIYYITQTNTYYGCTSDVATITVTVSPVIDNNIINGDQTLCLGTPADPLRQKSGTVSGGNGHYTYQWQQLTEDGFNWNDIPGETHETYSPGVLTSTAKFRRIVYSGPCSSESNIVTITAQGVLNNFGIGSNQTICEDEAPTLLDGQTPSGGTGSFTYKWESYTDNNQWSPAIGISDAEDYTPSTLKKTTHYRRIVTSGECTAISLPVTITVNPKPNGTISTPVASICVYDAGSVKFTATSGTAPFTLKLTVKSPSDQETAITQIINSASETITIFPAGTTPGDYIITLNEITDSKNCRREAIASSVTITVKPKPVLNIMPEITICEGSETTITVSGASNYNWSPSAGLSSTTGSTVTAKPTGTTTYFVTGTTDGCSVTASVTVNVSPKPLPPTIGIVLPYCLNSTPQPLNATALDGHTLTWYDNSSLTNGRTTAPTPGTTTAGIFNYYVTQTNSSNCTSDPATIQVTVYPAITENKISGDQTLCAGTTPSVLIPASTPAGGTGTYIYQWQQSIDGGSSWININGAVSPSYTPAPLATTTKYRRLITSGTCENTSNEVMITVQGTLINFEISQSQVICEATAPILLNGQFPVGGDGTFNYQWQVSSDKNTWESINGETSSTYQPGALSSTTYFRREVISGACSAYSQPVEIIVNPKPVIDPVEDLIVCNNATINTIPFSSTPSANVSYSWTNTDPEIGLAASGYGNLSSFTAINNSSQKVPVAGIISVLPVYSNHGASCTGNSASFTITILPTITISPVQDKVVCTGTMEPAFTPVHNAGQVSESSVTYSWDVSGSGIDLTNGSGNEIPVFSALNNGTTDLIAIITITPKYIYKGKTCDGTPVSYTVTVKPATPVANAGNDRILCGTQVYTMQAAPVGFATGLWSQLSGSAVVITNPAAYNTQVSGLQPGNTYRFLWTVTSAAECAATKDEVMITTRMDLTQANAGTDIQVCDFEVPGSVTLNANRDATRPYEATMWTIISKPQGSVASLSNTTDPQATFTFDKAGIYQLEWAIANDAGCEPNKDIVEIRIYDKVVSGTITGNTEICAANDVTFNLGGYVGNIQKWQYNPAPVSDDIWIDAGFNTAIATFTNVQETFAVRAVVLSSGSADGCTSSAISNAITINVAPATDPGTTSSSAVVCKGSNSGSITLSGNTGAIIRWEYSENNGANWTSIDHKGDILSYDGLLRTRWYRTVVKSGTCGELPSTYTVITVLEPVTKNTISGDPGVCFNGTPAPLQGSQPEGANGSYQYQWQMSTGNGSVWTDIDGATGINYTPPALTEETKFRRIVSSDVCFGPQSSTSNEVIIIINPNAKAAFTQTLDEACAPFVINSSIVQLQQAADRNSSYEWYANGNLIGTGVTFPGYTIDASASEVTIKLKAISSFGCLDDSISRTFRTFINPQASFTVNATEGCGPLSIEFNNNTPTASFFTYRWDFGNGQISTSAQPGSVTFQPHPLFGDTTYTITLWAYSQCDTTSFEKQITVKSAPKALFAPNRTIGCSPMPVTFTNTSLGLGVDYTWDLGDGTNFSTASTDTFSHVYHTGIHTTLHVKLKAENECGADATQYDLIISPNTVKLDFAVNGSELNGCAPHTVHFINNSRGASGFRWDFGDGTIVNTIKNIDTVTHTFLTAGVYNVQLHAFNGCSDTTSIETIKVHLTPKAAFSVNEYTVCLGDTVRLANQSENATSYLWQFDNGTGSNLQQPYVIFKETGTYNVKLNAFRANETGSMCLDSTTQEIQVVASQSGWFDVSDSVGSCAPFTVTFTNKNVPAKTVSWDFGDGETGSGNVMTHTYKKVGNYKVKLTVTVPGGCTYITERTISVAGPDGTITYDAGDVCNDEAVRFEATVTNTDSIRWDFGDGQTLVTTQRIVYHAYDHAGSYVPIATLLNNNSCPFVIKGVDTIKVDKLKAGFTFSKDEACGTTTLQFRDTAFAYSGKSNVLWKLGDNVSASGSSFVHDYKASGDYIIQQIITSNSGCTDTLQKTVNIHVNAIPVAFIEAMAQGCTNKDLIFNASIQSQDSVQIVKWSTSNNVSGNTKQFSVNFEQTGIYDLQLITGTVYGCFDTATHQIQVDPTPKVEVSDDLLTLCRDNSVQLSAKGAETYAWLPQQGLSCVDCSDPVATPLSTTPYVVKGMNSFGCFDYDSVVVTVIQPMDLRVSDDDSICIGTSTQLLASGADRYEWSPAAGLSATDVSNPLAAPGLTTSYRVIGYDQHNCFTDTASVLVAVGNQPKVSLGPDQTLSTGTLHSLKPVVQNGPVKKWEWSPVDNLNCSDCPDPVATIKRDAVYTLKITTSYNCTVSDTISIKTFCENSQVFVPNAFTPDGDGINDIMMVRAKGIAMVKTFHIYNRWGEIVFERNNFSPNSPAYGWDGKIKGKIGGPDVYIYTAEVICENGTTYTYRGNISLLK